MFDKNGNKWEVGETVKVGFLVLMVTGIRHCESHTEYNLISDKGTQYIFTPFKGIRKVTQVELELPNR